MILKYYKGRGLLCYYLTLSSQPSTLNSQPSTLNPQISNLKSQPSNLKADLTPLTAYCFLLFILIYFPCIATIAAIKHETGSWRWATVAAVYTTVLAWIVSALVHQLGQLFL